MTIINHTFWNLNKRNMIEDLSAIVMSKASLKPNFYGDQMSNLGLIDFKIGLYITFHVNINQCKIHISLGQNGYQLAQSRPDATLACEHQMGITRQSFYRKCHQIKIEPPGVSQTFSLYWNFPPKVICLPLP